jgi:hypothetical protein
MVNPLATVVLAFSMSADAFAAALGKGAALERPRLSEAQAKVAIGKRPAHGLCVRRCADYGRASRSCLTGGQGTDP